MNYKAKKLKTLAITILAALCFFSFAITAAAFYNDRKVFAEETTVDTVLDMDGSEASLEAKNGVNINVDNVLNSDALPWGIFPEATGATKMMFTKESVAAGETLTIRFNKAYKASDLLFVKIRMATNTDGNAGVTEAYSLADSSYTVSAGTLTSGSSVQNLNYYLDPVKLADADGYISGIVLKKTSGDATHYYFDYVELRTNSTGFDMDGEEAVLTAEGGVTVRADNTFNNTGAIDFGVFPNATGETKLSRTESKIAVGKTVTVKFASPIKAAANKGINVRLAAEVFQCVLHGYSVNDTAFEYYASVGKATLSDRASNLNVVMPSEILADSDGYVRGFVIKNVSGNEGRLDFDYVNVTEISSKYDLDGTEATIEAEGEVQTHADNTFNSGAFASWGIFPEAKGETKLMRTAGGISEGEIFDITFAVPMKAEAGKAVRVRMASEKAHGVTAGYALSDSAAEKAAGWKVVGSDEIVNFMLVLDSAALADGDGYIRGIRIKRTSGSSVVYDVDYVELGDAEDIKLDTDLTEAWFEAGGVKLDNSHPDNLAELNIFNGDGSSKITWTETMNAGESFNVKFGNRISAALYPYLNFRVAVGNWTEGVSVVSEIYSLSGNLAGSFTTGYGNFVDTFTISTASIADSDGFAEGFTVKKASGAAGQYFGDYVELVAAKTFEITVKDGETVTVKKVSSDEEFKLSGVGAADTDTQALVGFMINGKLYSEDYSFKPTADTSIEVKRISFKMRTGAMIRMGEISGLRFITDLSESEYNELKAVLGEENISLGTSMTKKSTNSTVRKPAENRYTDANGNIVWCGLLTNLPVEAYKTAFACQAYISVMFADKTGESYVYAIEDDNNRSIYEVAKKALSVGGLTEEQEAFCTDVVTKADEYAGEIAAINLPDYDAKESELSVAMSGWIIPKNLTAASAKLMTEAGINVMHAVAAGDNDTLFFDSYDAAAQSALKILNDNGVKVYVSTNSREASSFRKITSFKADEAVLGMSIDEPTKAEITALAKEVEYYNQNAGGKTFFANLFPSFASTVKNDFGNIFTSNKNKYQSYLSYYCDNVLDKLTTGEKWLSADRYLLTYDKNGAKCLDSGWLSDVESVATVANKYTGVKKNFFVQAMPYGADNGVALGNAEGSHDRVPTYEDIRLQEYALLAFGYEGMSMFCYGTPVAGGEFSLSQSAMIDRNGATTSVYDAVKRANTEILAFDHVLLQFAWQGVFTNDAGKTATGSNSTSNASFKNISRLSLNSVASLNKVYSSADTLFGYFKDGNGNDGIMAVNYNETSKNITDTVRLTFDAARYNKALCYVGGQKVLRSLTDGVLELNLGAGEGVFVIPYAA